MSSSSWPWQLPMGGVFSSNPVHSPFASYNKVLLGYCSSDAYMGDVAASVDTFGFAFRGRRIVLAALTQLAEQQQLGQPIPGARRKPRLVLAGCSAGARGAMVNADAVSNWLLAAGLDMELRLLLDSGLWLSLPPANPAIPSLAEQTQAAIALFGGNDTETLLGTDCMTALPDTPWECAMGQFRMPFISAPYVLNAAQFDAFQLTYDLGGTQPAQWNSSDAAFADQYQLATVAALQPLPTILQSSGNSSVFSAACFKHCLTDSSALWGIKIANPAAGSTPSSRVVSLRDVLFAWMEGAYHVPGLKKPIVGPPPEKVMDTCTGFRCGTCRTRGHGQSSAATHAGRAGRQEDAAVEAQQLEEDQSRAQSQEASAQKANARFQKREAKKQAKQLAAQQRASYTDTVSAARARAIVIIVLLITVAVFAAVVHFASSIARNPDRMIMSVMQAEHVPGVPPGRSDSPDQLVGRKRVVEAMPGGGAGSGAGVAGVNIVSSGGGGGASSYHQGGYGHSGYGAISTAGSPATMSPAAGGLSVGGWQTSAAPSPRGPMGGLLPHFALPQGLRLTSPGLDRWTPASGAATAARVPSQDQPQPSRPQGLNSAAFVRESL